MDQQPRAVTLALWLWGLVIVLSIASTLILAGAVRGGAGWIVVVSHVVQIVLIVFIARRHNWARWTVAVLLAISIVMFLVSAGAVFRASMAAGIMNLVGYAAAIAATALLFTNAASEWFLTRPAAPDLTPEERDRRRSTVRLGGGILGGVAVIVVGWLIWDPDFTDWEPIRALCLDHADAPGRERIAACAEIIDSDRFAGAEIAPIHMARAGLLRADEQFVRARGAYHEATLAEPDNAAAWRGVAEMRLLTGYEGLAVDAFDRAMTLVPDDAGLRGLRGMALFLDERYAEAIDDLQAALATFPTDPVFRVYLGLAAMEFDDFDVALGAAETVLAQAEDGSATVSEPTMQSVPWRELAGLMRSEALLELGRHAEALAGYRQLLETFPSKDNPTFGVIRVLCATGERGEAEDAIGQAIQDRVITAGVWRATLIGYGFLAATAPLPGSDTQVGPEVEAATQAWLDAGCPSSLAEPAG
ncbi:MAG: tetratricopeptide repeat protein [Alphaproteobacteria bacterium]